MLLQAVGQAASCPFRPNEKRQANHSAFWVRGEGISGHQVSSALGRLRTPLVLSAEGEIIFLLWGESAVHRPSDFPIPWNHLWFSELRLLPGQSIGGSGRKTMGPPKSVKGQGLSFTGRPQVADMSGK